jgi:hypothetical protein
MPFCRSSALDHPGSLDRVNPVLPEDTEFPAPSGPEMQEPERKELVSA